MDEQKASRDSFSVKDRRHWAEKTGPEHAPIENAVEAAQSASPAAHSENSSSSETRSFQAETRQLLQLMIHSLYSHKEIFLRELISNASDALDRRRFEALTRPDLLGDTELEIRLETDAAARTLTITDNGIGMSRDELVTNIGTIAKSGTRELIGRINQAQSATDRYELIGQFGVGFYSSFMVADRIQLVTRRAGEEHATLWESTGDGTYSISSAQRAQPGTSVTLQLKPADAEAGIEDYLDQWVIQRLVKKYSDFVRYPIRMKWSRSDLEMDADGKPLPDGKQVTVVEDKIINSMKAIWKRRPSEVRDEEYAEFYHHISHHWDKPQKTIVLNAEGRVEYQAVMFVPAHAPYDLFHQGTKSGLELYVRSVKIMEQCEQLLPQYLRFIRGVVEASDLPLNVSRELLQQNRVLLQIQRGLVKKVLDTLGEMQEKEPDKYLEFWREFGRVIKEGVGSDADQKEKLTSLLLFQSSADPEKLTTLHDYVKRMKDGQDDLFYLTGDTRAQIEGSPHLEAFRDKGYEVLYLVDPVDEFVVETVSEVDGKKLKSVGKGEVKLGSKEEQEATEKEIKEQAEQATGLLDLLQKKLTDEVKEVRLSARLTKSPVCLVSQEHDASPHLRRLMKQGNIRAPHHRRILELNAKHPLYGRMKQRYEQNHDDPVLGDYAQLLYGQALLLEGSELPDPISFSHLVADLMVRAGQ